MTEATDDDNDAGNDIGDNDGIDDDDGDKRKVTTSRCVRKTR